MTHVENKARLEETLELKRTTEMRLKGASASPLTMIEPNPVHSPGPGFYTPNADAQHPGSSHQGYTLVSKSKVGGIVHDVKTPGPGAYDPRYTTHSHKPAAPIYSLAGKTSVLVTETPPGPGAYVSSTFAPSSGGPAGITMGSRYAERSSLNHDERGLVMHGQRPRTSEGAFGFMHTPGPDVYEPDYKLGSQNLRKPAYSMPGRPKPTTRAFQTPGPGAYFSDKIPSFTSENKFAVSIKSRGNSVQSLSGSWPLFGGVPARDHSTENEVIVFPGPADYNPTHPRLSKPIEPAPGESYSFGKKLPQAFSLFTSSIDNPAATFHMENRGGLGTRAPLRRPHDTPNNIAFVVDKSGVRRNMHGVTASALVPASRFNYA